MSPTRRSRSPGRRSGLRAVVLRVGLVCGSLAIALLAAELALRGYFALEARRSHGTFDLYAIGGSTMVGEPFDVLTDLPRLALALLPRAASRGVAVHNLAVEGDSIYPQAVALVLRLRARDNAVPAAVLIYSGHNESIQLEDPGGAALSAAPSPTALWLLRHSALVAFVAPRVGRFLADRGIRPSARWLVQYESYLRLAIEVALDAGVTPILSTVVGNTAGIDPYPPQLERTAAEQALVGDAVATFIAGPPDDAEARFRAVAAAIPDLSIWAQWGQGQAALMNGRADVGVRLIEDAWERTSGAKFGIAKDAQNDLVRRLAEEYAVPLVDTAATFRAQGSDGLPPAYLFVDGHHPSVPGYLLIARGFASEILRLRAVAEPLAEITPEEIFARWAHKNPGAFMDAYLSRILWLMSVSVNHPAPVWRRRLAEANLNEVARIAPDRLVLHFWRELLPVVFAPAFLRGASACTYRTLPQALFVDHPCELAHGVARVIEVATPFGLSAAAGARLRAAAERVASTCPAP